MFDGSTSGVRPPRDACLPMAAAAATLLPATACATPPARLAQHADSGLLFALLAAALALLAWLLLLRAGARLRAGMRENARLTDALKLAGIGYWEYDLEQGWLAWSDATLALFGISRTDFGGTYADFIARVHAEDRPRLEALRGETLATGAPLDVRYRVLRPDGSERTLDEQGHLHVHAGGRRVLLGTVRDVTALVEAGRREQRQAEQYRYLFERNPVPLAVYDRRTLAVLAVNAAALERVGYTRERLLAMRAPELLLPAERTRFARHLAGAGAEQVDAGVYGLAHRDGRALRCQIYGQDIVFDGHDARLVMLHDVTAAELAHAALEASEARLRLAARASNDAIWDYDIVAGTLWRNEGYTTLFGYAAGDATSSFGAWTARIHPDDRARVEASFTHALAHAVESWQEDYRYRHVDGHYLDVHDRGYVLRDAEGRAMRMVGGMHDRSNEVNARRDLEQRERNYRLLVEQMPVPLLVLHEGHVRMANAAAAALLRAGAPEHLCGCAVESLFDAAAVAACRASVSAPTQAVETALRCLDGSVLDGHLTIADFSGSEVGGVQVLLRDLGAERRRIAADEERVAFFRLSADGFGILDAAMRITEVNAALRNLFVLANHAVPITLADVLDQQHCARVRDAWQQLRPGEASEPVECLVQGRGADAWVELGFVRARSDTWYMVARDISRQMRAEAEARLLQRAVEAVENGVVITDARAPEMPLVYVNPAFTRITGFAASESLGRNVRFLYRDDVEQAGLLELERAQRAEQPASVVLRNYRRDGSLFWSRLRMAPVHDALGLSHWVGIQQDISEERRAEERLRQQALTDDLTGLPNRRALLAGIGALLPREPLALVHVGLDQFKLINDALGHASGDDLLRALAARLRTALPEAVQLARIGGDEFVALVPRVAAQMECILERIGGNVRQPVELQGAVQQVNCSIGIALAPEHGDSAEAVLRAADAALHEAKRQGRNRSITFSAHLHEQASQRLAVISRLRDQALDTELALHYQSIHDGSSGAITGVELLLRWPGGPESLRSPAVLVPLLEESGLILPVGRWVLGEACRRQRSLQGLAAGGCKVALNVSAQQLMLGDFVREVREALDASAADPRLLELEITESALMADPAKAEEILQQLKRMGVGIAIDDFGTGYSSLGYLHRLSADKLKIDRSFVRDVLSDADDALICTSIIQLAHNLGLRVVAEGVETEAQRRWLAERGCEQMQGYLFARPQPFVDAQH